MVMVMVMVMVIIIIMVMVMVMVIFITRLSKLTGAEVDNVLAKFCAIFFFFFQCNMIIGNSIRYALCKSI